MLSRKPRPSFIRFVGIATIGFGLCFITEKSVLADELGYLGPTGTYSEQATKVYQSQTPGFEKVVPYKTITAVTTAIKSSEVKRGLIPIENSDSGFVAETYRLIFEKIDPEWRIIDEVTIPITSSLLVKTGTKASNIKQIISHPNALRGVATYLKQNFPEVPLIEVNSTAAAAKLVSNGDGTTAAVASPNAAKVYGLQTIATNIQDNNYETNFWIIARSNLASFDPNSNHLIISIKAPSGSRIFSETIAKLQKAGFYVVNVNSIPLGESIHSYRYLIRFESKSQNFNNLKQVKTLLKAMQNSDGEVILLGAYQR
ncbi:prephenate dehydratase [Rivularia sp. PCC 7116]|uniref:prephenate dehydratase n=1 Tax=Rivularia sp. PCC 7116 TaxID=373994 RepID=UPI00029F4387|nr:prephenate dehydratase domain-containing protein [Rivularia sp. PCC 7116]AFY57006.1 prephenate dehydratase [Rivularia sp. PCC 7116]